MVGPPALLRLRLRRRLLLPMQRRRQRITRLLHTTNPSASGQGGAELILVPRKASRLHDVAVYLDPQTSLPRRMVWHYNDGQIVLETTYAHIGDHYVVATQHAEAHFPMFRGWAQSQVSQYAFNVPIDDAIFTPKKAAQ